MVRLFLLISSACLALSIAGCGEEMNRAYISNNVPVAPSAKGCNGTLSLSQKLSKPAASFKKMARTSNSEEVNLLIDLKCLKNQPAGTLLQKVIESNSIPPDILKRGTFHSVKWKATGFDNIDDLAAQDPCILQIATPSKLKSTSWTGDTYKNAQEHFTAIQATAATENAFFGAGGITQDVVIAIIDSGVAITHPDISPQVWVNTDEVPGNSIDDDGNGFIDDVNGYNFVSDLASPAPIGADYHGTAVAGIAAAKGGNGIGIAGVMGSHAKIMALNVFGGEEEAADSDVANAIYYAINNGAHVINLSLGGEAPTPVIGMAIQAAVGAGVVVVGAAGNNEGAINYPAAYAELIDGYISVAATYSRTYRMAFYSSRGEGVEIAAPANDATGKESTNTLYQTGLYTTALNGSYMRMMGTSSASPVVAGAAALTVGYLTSNGKAVSPAIVEDLIISSAEQYVDLSDLVMGCRHLDLTRLMTSLQAQ